MAISGCGRIIALAIVFFNYCGSKCEAFIFLKNK